MKRKYKILNVLILLCFYAYLIMQFQKVFIYYDDYGYLSLSYIYNHPEVKGSYYTFWNLLEFMKQQYFVSNGRLLYIFIFCFLNMIGGISAIQLFMASGIFLLFCTIIYLLNKVVKLNDIAIPLMTLFVCLLYGIIDISLHRLGTYWFAASFLYVIPAVMFLIYTLFYYKTTKMKVNVRKQIICVILAFLSSFSQEGWFVAGLIVTLGIIIIKKIFNKLKLYDLVVFIGAIIGALPILTSPAVKVRMINNSSFYELSFIERIVYNIKNILNNFFHYNLRNYVFLLLITFLFFGLYLIYKKSKFKIFNYIYVIFNSALILYLIMLNQSSIFETREHSEFMLFMLFLYLVLSTIQVIRLFIMNNDYHLIIIFLASIGSLGCMVIVPEIPLRSFLPFIFLSFINIGYIFGKICLESINRSTVIIVLFFLCYISIPNMYNIYKGYDKNYEVLTYNDHKIKETVEAYQDNHDEEDEIKLYKTIDILYGGEMVYYGDFGFMENWMREYYDIPDSLKLTYYPYKEKKNE